MFIIILHVISLEFFRLFVQFLQEIINSLLKNYIWKLETYFLSDVFFA